MRSIVILGAGELGGALARQLAAADFVRQVTLVDAAGAIAEGKALDIRQAAPVDGYSTSLVGTADESAAIGADVIVLADPAGSSGDELEGDGGLALLGRVAYSNDTAFLLCAGARQLDVVERGVRELGIPRERLLGSAPEGLRSAVLSMTALEAACVPGEISLTVLGRPPAQIIVPWEDASIGGRRAREVLGPPAVTRLEARLPRLWPPGPLTLAAAATRLLVSAAARRPEGVIAFVAVTRDEGNRGRVAMLPITVGPQGLAKVLMPTLSTRDQVRLDTALHR